MSRLPIRHPLIDAQPLSGESRLSIFIMTCSSISTLTPQLQLSPIMPLATEKFAYKSCARESAAHSALVEPEDEA